MNKIPYEEHAMTVGQLIECLKLVNPELKVFMPKYVEGWDFVPVSTPIKHEGRVFIGGVLDIAIKE